MALLLGEHLKERYQILAILQEDRNFTSYLAIDHDAPIRGQCVIEVLRLSKNSSSSKTASLLARELGTVSAINYIDIPCLYEFFFTSTQEADYLYLVREYIEGETLSNIISREGVFEEIVVEKILKSLLTTLNYLYSNHIVHRDINPNDIILRRSNNRPIIMNLISLKTIINDLEKSIISNITETRSIGIEGYSPPEQFVHSSPHSDSIFNLGVTAIYLLTGKKLQELEINPEPWKIIWRPYASKISLKFAEVIDKATAYRPRDRFASPEEMLMALSYNIIFHQLPSMEQIQGDLINAPTIPHVLRFSSFIRDFLYAFEDSTLINLAYIFLQKSKYAIAFGLGGALVGSLTSNTLISILGAITGAIYGFLQNTNKSNLTSGFVSDKSLYLKKMSKRIENLIASSLGGAFIGGIFGNFSGSIIGAIAGGILGYFTATV